MLRVIVGAVIPHALLPEQVLAHIVLGVFHSVIIDEDRRYGEGGGVLMWSGRVLRQVRRR